MAREKASAFISVGLRSIGNMVRESAPSLERQTLHVMDDKQRIALIETQTIGNDGTGKSPVPAQRYQLANHLGSASLELDCSGGPHLL